MATSWGAFCSKQTKKGGTAGTHSQHLTASAPVGGGADLCHDPRAHEVDGLRRCGGRHPHHKPNPRILRRRQRAAAAKMRPEKPQLLEGAELHHGVGHVVDKGGAQADVEAGYAPGAADRAPCAGRAATSAMVSRTVSSLDGLAAGWQPVAGGGGV